MMRHPSGLLFLILLLFTPTAAQAHLVNSGLGPFYDGALHLILSPMDIVRLTTLCLFAGAQDPRAGRYAAIAAPIAWFVASASALSLDAAAKFELINAVCLFLLGAAVAFDLKLRPLVISIVAAGFAGLLGFQSGVALRSDNVDWGALLGTTAVASVIILLVTSFVLSATAFPVRVACRVLGSWASATGLLSIGWIMAASR